MEQIDTTAAGLAINLAITQKNKTKEKVLWSPHYHHGKMINAVRTVKLFALKSKRCVHRCILLAYRNTAIIKIRKGASNVAPFYDNCKHAAFSGQRLFPRWRAITVQVC